MNFADQYKESKKGEPLMEIEVEPEHGFSGTKLVRISEAHFMEVAREANLEMIRALKEGRAREGLPSAQEAFDTMMTNIHLIEDIRRALFGDKDVPEKK